MHFVNEDLRNCSFYDCDFAGATFENCNLEGVMLSRCELEGASFEKAILNGVRTRDLKGAPSRLPHGWVMVKGHLIGPGVDLRYANLRDEDLSEAELNGADLSWAFIDGAKFSRSNLVGVLSVNVKGDPLNMPPGWNLIGGVFVGPGANLVSKDFRGCDFKHAHLDSAELFDAVLDDVSSGHIIGTPNSLPNDWVLKYGYLLGPRVWLEGESLSSLNLSNLNLSNGNLQGCELRSCNLSDTVFADANLQDAKLISCSIQGADFSSSHLFGLTSTAITGEPKSLPLDWTLSNGYLLGPSANLESANLKELDLSHQNLQGASLRGACLCGANLVGTDLRNANLSMACFDNADLSQTKLTDANIGEANMGNARMTVPSDVYRKIPVAGRPSSLPENCEYSKGFLIVFPNDRRIPD